VTVTPVTAWQAPGDPRHAITVDDLLRMQSGLAPGNSLTAGVSSGWNTAARTLFNEPDMAGFPEAAELEVAPGTVWIRGREEIHRLCPGPSGLPQGLFAPATAVPPASFTSSPWPAPTAPTSACSASSPASTSS
jgi:hypothetical protein